MDTSNVSIKVLDRSTQDEEQPQMSSKENLTYLRTKYAASRGK
jgi:hypothetical protein